MEVTVGEINLGIRGSVLINELSINDQQGEEMLTIHHFETKVGWINWESKRLRLNRLDLRGLKFMLKKHRTDDFTNLAFFLQHFISKQAEDTAVIAGKSDPWKISCKNLQIRNAHFIYDNEDNHAAIEGIDFNDIEILDMDLLLTDLFIDRDTISGFIHNLVFIEKSGFELKEFSGNAKFSPVGLQVSQLKIITNQSDLNLDLQFKYNDLGAFSNFITDVHFDATFRDSELEFSDIGYFAPLMFTMTDRILLTGDFSGKVCNLKGTDFSFHYGDQTRFSGSVRMNGLPDITESFIHASVKSFTTDAGDIESFRLPAGAANIIVPPLLHKMGEIRVRGKFTGFYNDFVSNADFRSNIGSLSTDIMLKAIPYENSIGYSGKLKGKDLDIGELFALESILGKTSFTVNVDGAGVNAQNLDVTLDGAVGSFFFQGYDYKDILVDGNLKSQIFNGKVSAKDENLDFEFSGLADFTQQIPTFDFAAKINNANLYNLNIIKRDPVCRLSTYLDIDFAGVDIDNVEGGISVDSTVYQEGFEVYFVENIKIQSNTDSTGNKKVELFSDMIDAGFAGNFTISKLMASVKEYVHNYSDIISSQIKSTGLADVDQNITFQVDLKNTDIFSRLFFPQIKIAPESRISGLYDSKNDYLKIDAGSGYIDISGVNFNSWSLHSNSTVESFTVKMESNNVMIQEPSEYDSTGIGIDSLQFNMAFFNDTLNYHLLWNDLDNSQTNTGKVWGTFELINKQLMISKIDTLDLVIDKVGWDINNNNSIVLDTMGVKFRDLRFFSDSSLFSLNGGISRDKNDSLQMEFRELDITYLENFIPGSKIDVGGILNGTAVFVDLYSNPNFLVNISLTDLMFNDQNFGDLNLATKWNDPLGMLAVKLGVIRRGNIGESEVISLNGNYFPLKKVENFDFDIRLNNLNTHVFNPFVEEYIHIDRASLASGKLHVTGSYSNPVVEGDLNLMRTQFLLKYLNVLYSASGSFEFGENFINVNQIKLYDTDNRSASCSGNIFHDYFRDFRLDVLVSQENFRSLNTTSRDNNLFYGNAIVSGEVDIKGPFDDIKMNIKATTEKGTNLMIPISSSITVSENDFIIFVNNADSVAVTEQSYNLNLKGLTMQLDLDVTPDADIQIFLPYGMGNIKGSGNGDIRLGINPRGDFTINGDYIISEGEFYFTIENLIGRDFRILNGSKISWTGSPYDASVDIRGVFPVRTTLTGLQLQTDSSSVYNTKIQVNCYISLKNALFNPDIQFAIDFPNVADDVKQIIYASLDTTDQSVMSQQILSLLVLKSFSYTTNNPDIGVTGFKLLSNQLSGWLSRISQDFDIGINYQPGTKLTQDELEVALRTQLFDDRLSIDGNFGVKGTTREQNTSNVVGDIDVEYKITEDGRFRVRAFNRTNDISFLEDNAPYTQGVGIFYRKEFENFKDLFKRSKDRKKKTKRNINNDQAVRGTTGDEEE